MHFQSDAMPRVIKCQSVDGVFHTCLLRIFVALYKAFSAVSYVGFSHECHGRFHIDTMQ